MHCPGSDPMAARGAPPECGTCLFCHGLFHFCKPGRVAPRSGRSAGGDGARHPHAPPHLGECARREGARRTRESGHAGMPGLSSEARRTDPPLGWSKARRTDGADRTMIPKIVPQFQTRPQPCVTVRRTPSADPAARSPGGSAHATGKGRRAEARPSARPQTGACRGRQRGRARRPDPFAE